MCGLFAFIGATPDEQLLQEVARLAGRRGPHACGWAQSDDGERFAITRREGSLSAACRDVQPSRIVVGHSRLSTMGGTSYRDLRDAQPLTLPGAVAETSGPILVHNGVASVQYAGPLDTGCDSEAILRLAARAGNLFSALACLPADEPFAAIYVSGGVLEAGRRGLPLFARQTLGGVYLCSVPFDGAAQLGEATRHHFRVT
jgi:hypothetical protein